MRWEAPGQSQRPRLLIWPFFNSNFIILVDQISIMVHEAQLVLGSCVLVLASKPLWLQTVDFRLRGKKV